MNPINNDDVILVPQTHFDGKSLEFDFPGLEIGVAEYDEGPTGGSLMGLEATAGVKAELFTRTGYDLARQPLVNGAIIFDFGGRKNRIYPDGALGRAAMKAARPGVFPLGARGVGRSAGVGGIFGDGWGESSGQGGAFRELGETKIAVFIVVNALGAVHDRSGRVVRGSRNPATGEHVQVMPEMERRIAQKLGTQPPAGNTTLTVVVTNHKLDRYSLAQFSKQVHSSLARVIQPFHTVDDGDVLYTVSTNQVESGLSVTALGLVASEVAWDAVLSAVSA